MKRAAARFIFHMENGLATYPFKKHASKLKTNVQYTVLHYAKQNKNNITPSIILHHLPGKINPGRPEKPPFAAKCMIKREASRLTLEYSKVAQSCLYMYYTMDPPSLQGQTPDLAACHLFVIFPGKSCIHSIYDSFLFYSYKLEKSTCFLHEDSPLILCNFGWKGKPALPPTILPKTAKGYILGRVHISACKRLFGGFLSPSSPKILEARKYIREFVT